MAGSRKGAPGHGGTGARGRGGVGGRKRAPARQSPGGRAGGPSDGAAELGGEARVLVSREGGVATLTLNRPDKRNALDRRMIAELKAAITTCDLAADVRVVALRGAGKDFCAGLDLDELLASADLPPEENERRAMELGEIFIALRALPKVTVAVVHGTALAGGCGLATACDLVVAKAGSQFGYPEINRGFVPAMVMTMLRRAVGEKVTFDLAATGRVLDAADAECVGLISRVLAADGFDAEVTKLLSSLAGLSATALALTKQQFYRLDGIGFADGVRLGAEVNAVARATPDFRQAIAAFLKK